MGVALADARTRFDIPKHALAALVDGGLQDTEQLRYASYADLRTYCEKVAGAVGVACVAIYGSEDVERARTLGIALQLINIMRDVAEDWQLGRVYLPQDELAAHGVTEDEIAEGRVTAEWRFAHVVPGRAGARSPRRGTEAARLTRPAERALRVDVRRFVPRAARSHRGKRLRRVRPVVQAVDSCQAGSGCARTRAVNVAVVGGGLAGLAAALDLADAGADVTLYEARPTAGCAVQTLPAREGDPDPPPDNGQHIALGCFTEYLRFLDRIGEAGSVRRTRLALPVIAEDGSVSSIRPTPAALVAYGHLPFARPAAHSARARAHAQGAGARRRDVRCDAAAARCVRCGGRSLLGRLQSVRRSTCPPTRSTHGQGSSPFALLCSGRARTPTSSCP